MRSGLTGFMTAALIGSGMLVQGEPRVAAVDPQPAEKKRHTNARQTARYKRQMERKRLKRKE